MFLVYINDHEVWMHSDALYSLLVNTNAEVTIRDYT